MPWHARKPEEWYAIRIRKGARGTTYRVSLTRAGATIAALFRAGDYGSDQAAATAARAWRNQATNTMKCESKQAFSQRLRPDNSSGCAGVYLRTQRIKRGNWVGEYAFWQAVTPDGIKPRRTRSFAVERYGYDGAYGLAVQARAEFVKELDGYVGVAPIPERFRPKRSQPFE